MKKEKIIYILRWIIVTPGAIFGAWLSYFVITTINRITMSRFINPDIFLSKLYLESTGQLLLGLAFVYCASKIAPDHKKRVVFFSTILMAILMGICLFPAIMTKNYWAIYGCIMVTIGAVSYCWYTFYNSEENQKF